MSAGWKRERCLCDLCVRISPMQNRIRAVLPEDLRKDFEYLMTKLFIAEEDLAATEAKLSGDWPGWEWMKEARIKAEGRIDVNPPSNTP